MKSITNILRRSNLTPFERVRALVHNDIQREKTGVQQLSESDLYVLTKGWNASYSEATQYNRYIHIIQLEDSMKMDAQMFLCRSELSLLRNQRVLDGFIAGTKKLKDAASQSFILDASLEESIHFLTQHTYLEYEKVLHILTFRNLPNEIQNDLLLLDEEVSSDGKYLADHVFLYERFAKDGTLREEDKDLIIERMYSCMYHGGLKKLKNSTAEKDGFLPYAFFAELPIRDLFQKWIGGEHAKEDDDMGEQLLSQVEARAKNMNVSIEKMVKEFLSEWLDSGLFVSEYSPLFLSERFDTWNGNTKNNHKTLFMTWYMELQKSKQFLQKLIDAGKLQIHTLGINFLGVPKMTEVLTGESLYACAENIDFVKEYKRQIELLTPVAGMFLFVKKYATPNMNYRTLCEFKNLAQKVSIFFDIDMTEKYAETVELYKEEVGLLNHSLGKLVDMEMECLYTEESLHYFLNIHGNDFIFDLDTDDGVAGIFEKYSEEFKKLIN